MNRYQPFPVKLLPAPVARFVGETARAMNVDPAFVGLPVLATMAGAIGTTRSIGLKDGWTEPPILWTAIIARSGTMKSPALEAAVRPLAQLEHLNQTENQRVLAEHEAAKLQYEKDLAVWKRDKGGGEPPTKPEAPARTRHIVSDTTLEALAVILQENPRGVLVARDELSGLLRSFNQYKSKGGADAAAWLEFHRAGRVSVDRKSSLLPISIKRAAVSVCGTIQPGVFADIMRGEHTESGMMARFLVARPPIHRKSFGHAAPSQAAVDGYDFLIHRLARLEHFDGEHGPEPLVLHLDRPATAAWAAWYDRFAVRQYEAAEDVDAAVLAKLEAAAARLALLFALADSPHVAEIPEGAILRGCAMADWLAAEALRVYGLMADDEAMEEMASLIDWVTRQGGSVTARDVTRNLRRYRSVDDAERALAGLVEAGWGVLDDVKPGPRGGRPSQVFRLLEQAPTVDETSKTLGNSELCRLSAGEVSPTEPPYDPDRHVIEAHEDDPFEQAKRAVGIDPAAARRAAR